MEKYISVNFLILITYLLLYNRGEVPVHRSYTVKIFEGDNAISLAN